MKGKFIAEEHRKGREAKEKARKDAEVDEAAFHEAIDEKNRELAKEALQSLPVGEITQEPEVVSQQEEVTVDPEPAVGPALVQESEEASNDEDATISDDDNVINEVN